MHALLGYLVEDGCCALANEKHEILEGRELLIGRDHKICNVILTDITISKQHLLVYSIAYPEDNHLHIFVYAKDISTNGSYWRYKQGNNWRESLIGRDNAVLLSDGDKIRLCNGSCFSFQPVRREMQYPEVVSTAQEDDTKLFMNLITVTNRKLGSGGCGEVWMAVDNYHKRQVACKVVKLGKSPQQRAGRARFTERLWREVELLQDLSHPNIIHVERVFFSEDNLYIISDFITGGDLMSYIERPWTGMDDAEACIIIYQILKALEYLHQLGICHRDLKPENILMSTPAPGARVILADFGHSTKLSSARASRMKTTAVGTDYYVAPEVRGKNRNPRGYTMAADIWSLGVTTMLLLTGDFVFENSKNEYISSTAKLDAVADCDLAEMVHSSIWQNIDEAAKAFVKSLLVLDEGKRLRVGQALEHGWFINGERKKIIPEKYEEAIRGWVPSEPLLDFKQDLALFKDTSKSTLDSILMPPPAKPNSNSSLRRPLHVLDDGQQWSPFFSQETQDGATKIEAQTGKKRGLESDEDANTPSSLLSQAIPANKRPNNDLQSETKKLLKSSAKQIVQGELESLFQFESCQSTPRGPSPDEDYEERRLYDRVSREEAGIFSSAKSYGQSVEKRRRLDH